MNHKCSILISGRGNYKSFESENQLIDLIIPYNDSEFGYACSHYRPDIESWDITYYQNRLTEYYDSWDQLNTDLSKGHVYYDLIPLSLESIRADISNVYSFHWLAIEPMIRWLILGADLSTLDYEYVYVPEWDDQKVIHLINEIVLKNQVEN